MISYTGIEQKIKSMSAHDIIMAMVEGLRSPKTRIDMQTYGEVRDGICFGCAATNAVLNIMNANKKEVEAHSKFRSTHDDYKLYGFEYAIDKLRCGSLEPYNASAYAFGFAKITPIPGQELPMLLNDYTEEQLKEYEKLAKHQLTIKTQNND